MCWSACTASEQDPLQRCAALAATLKQYRETAGDKCDETLHDVSGHVATAGSPGKTDHGALTPCPSSPAEPHALA